MDSFELNKILGAVLGTCLVLLSLNIAASAVFTPHKPAKPGYDIAVAGRAPAGGKPGAAAAADEPIAELLASADVGRGETSAKKCVACHTFDKGGPTGSARISTASSAAPRRRTQASTIRRR